MRRLVIGNAVLAIMLSVIILISFVNTGVATLSTQTVSPQVVVTNAVTQNHFTIVGYPNSITAGQSFSGITVTVYNSAGCVVTNYKGKVYFTSTDPKATMPYTSQNPYTFTIGSKGDKGVHTFSGFNLATAGSQTITVTDGSILATTSAITVNDGSPISIAISPTTATIVAGSKQSYTSKAMDQCGNIWDVTSLSTWSISNGAGGSWSSNTYTSAVAGTWTVTGSYSNLYSSASLSVTPASAISIAINPKTGTITAGSLQTFTVSASDNYGNTWSVTSSTVWSISSGAGGFWSQNTYTSHKSGIWTVTGIWGTLSASASLNVTHASASSISLTPISATISAGTSQAFTATATDSYSNTWDVSNSTSWSISSGAGGSWSNNSYISAEAGIWTVTGIYGSVSNTATLTVGYCLTFKILISPTTSTLTAGSSEAFTAVASDIYGNVWNVTSSTTWSIDNGAGGSWLNNAYTSSTSGVWIVTGTYKGISGTGTITVNNGLPVQLLVNAPTSSQTAGSNATFTSIAIDNCNNEWDATKQTSWIISSGAGGSCLAMFTLLPWLEPGL